MEYYDGEQKRWLPVTPPSKAPTATQQHAANATSNGSLMKNSSFVAHLYSNSIDGVNNLPINSNYGNMRFLPWKGSALDFVVGVCLTQSVRDSSSR